MRRIEEEASSKIPVGSGAQGLGEDIGKLQSRLNKSGDIDAARDSVAQLISMPEDMLGFLEGHRVFCKVNGRFAVEK